MRFNSSTLPSDSRAPAAGVGQELFGIESALGVHEVPLYLQPHFRHEL